MATTGGEPHPSGAQPLASATFGTRRERVTVIVLPDRRLVVKVNGQDVAPEAVETLLALGGDPPTWYARTEGVESVLDQAPEVDAQVVLDFAVLPDTTRRTRLDAALGAATLPVWMAWMVACDPKPTIRSRLAARFPGAPDYAPVAWAMTEDEETTVRKHLAAAVTFPDVLDAMALDEDHLVRMRVARNPATPSGTLWHLADDDHSSVRQALAETTHVPGLLAMLSKDGSERVRCAVAENPATPQVALRQMRLEDAWDYVHVALDNRGVPTKAELMAAPTPPAPVEMSGSPDPTPDATLGHLPKKAARPRPATGA